MSMSVERALDDCGRRPDNERDFRPSALPPPSARKFPKTFAIIKPSADRARKFPQTIR